MHKKTRAVEILRCCVCRHKYPRPFMNLHHRQPREAGGGDEPANQAWLCAGCHQNMHRLVEMMLRGEGGPAADCAATIYPHPKPRMMIMTLAREAAYHLVHMQELGVRVTAAAKKSVTLELSGIIYQQLRVLSQQTRGRRGEPLSVPRYIHALITRHLANPLF